MSGKLPHGALPKTIEACAVLDGARSFLRAKRAEKGAHVGGKLSHGPEVEKILKMLGKRGMASILDAIAGGRKRFVDIDRVIGNPATTERHLKLLVRSGILTREPAAEKYGPVYYSLTERGERIYRLVVEMEELSR